MFYIYLPCVVAVDDYDVAAAAAYYCCGPLEISSPRVIFISLNVRKVELKRQKIKKKTNIIMSRKRKLLYH